jgi:hypothetical protein
MSGELLSLGEQMFQPNAFLVDQLVGIAIFGVATAGGLLPSR